jgi:hypothetical protein
MTLGKPTARRFKVNLWKRYLMFRLKPGPFRWTWLFEIEMDLARWL